MQQRPIGNGPISGPQVTWANVTATLLALAAMVGGAWTLVQAQRQGDRDYLESQLKSIIERASIIHKDNERREMNFKEEVLRLRDRVTREEQLVVRQDEFRQFSARAEDHWRQQSEVNRFIADAYLTIKTFKAWKEERDKTIERLVSRLEQLEQKR